MLTISCDTETTGIDLRHSCRPFFVSICEPDSDPLFWQWRVDPLTRMPAVDPSDVAEIIEWLERADEIVFQNAKFDIAAFSTIGIKWKSTWWKKVQDTLFSGHLLGSAEDHDLTAMALNYCRVDIKPFEDALEQAVQEARRLAKKEYPNWRIATKGDPGLPSAKGGKDGKKLWKWDMWLPRTIAEIKHYNPNHEWWTVLSTYGTGDTAITLPIRDRHKEAMELRGLTGIYDKRRRLVKTIYKMESRGVTANSQRLDTLYDDYKEGAEIAEKVCINLSSGKLDKLPKSGTSNAMRELLIDDWKLEPLEYSKKSGEPSIDKNALEAWALELPTNSVKGSFIRNLRAYRKQSTALSYIEGYRRFGIPVVDVDGLKHWLRLYPWLNPTGSDTLRFSSSNPNEQNISKQEGFNLRYGFGPARGREWWSLDYENIELRLPAYEADEEEMIQLFERPDDPPYFGSVHLLMFDTLHPEMFAKHGKDVKKVYAATWYQWTKNGDFAVQYGAMLESGTADRAYHVPGAQAKIQARFRKIDQLNQLQIEFARKYGYVTTMEDKEVGGYPLQCTRDKWGRIRPTVPLNYHVQGTAMWAMCRAMVRCEDYLESIQRLRFDPFMTMQVHDEIVFDFPRGARPDSNLPHIVELKRQMERSGGDIGVPLKVAYSYHPDNWSESEKLAA